MKKLLFALCALAAIALLTPNAGYAQWQNRVGIYATAAADSANFNPVGTTSFYVYFILHTPTATDGSPITAVKGWEYTVTVTGPAEGFIKTGDLLPPNSFNIGNAEDPFNATYFVAMAAAQPVVNQMFTLHRWTLKVYDNSEPYYFFLSPFSPATIEGKLAFLDAGGLKVAATGSSGDYEVPVFSILGGVVAAQSETFGSVKALFR